MNNLNGGPDAHQGADLCDEMKLLKLLEHERKKKAKLSHAGGLWLAQQQHRTIICITARETRVDKLGEV